MKFEEFKTQNVLLAIDPGGTTGLALRTDTLLSTFTTKDPVDVWEILVGIKKSEAPHIQIIIERYAGIFIDKHGLATVEIVGGVTAICTILHLHLARRTPVQRIPKKEEARELLLIVKGRGNFLDHEVDALAHLLKWEQE